MCLNFQKLHKNLCFHALCLVFRLEYYKLSLKNQLNFVTCNILDQGVEPQYNLLHVDGWAVGQEGEAPLPRSLLTLGLHESDAEVEVTTLILGPPGSEKEAIEKAKLDLHLKI